MWGLKAVNVTTAYVQGMIIYITNSFVNYIDRFKEGKEVISVISNFMQTLYIKLS